MELKNYQKRVIDDLKNYIQKIIEIGDYQKAYKDYWQEKGVTVGGKVLPNYNNQIPNTPHICFKVPTGGGKTYLAANAIKPIFDSMPETKTKSVVWLVPSDAILEQTTKNLKNPNHPYHQVISRDFHGKIEIYTKQELLTGQNFNPTTIREQLSIFILSYDSIRSNKKDGRKIYQENGYLQQFPTHYTNKDSLLENVDETALIQVINQLSPVIIVDESHHATTKLSIEMLQNLNPSFIIDLTATPKQNSNIISYVEASELKKENMVKIPLIAYNRNTKDDVILDAVDLRNNLEKFAQNEPSYIRPIVLFQAEPKGKEDAATYQKLKTDLIEIGIPEEQIAIKTASINEIKNIDLLSPNCKIRYIITINALKEGWDCPFAYILATLANRTSKTDVEQIVGRILRQPHTRQHQNKFLNLSYVFTSSNTFSETVEDIIKGLNNAGFSKLDCRVADDNTQEGQNILDPFLQRDNTDDTEPALFIDDRNELSKRLKERQEASQNSPSQDTRSILDEADKESEDYNKKTVNAATYGNEDTPFLPSDIRENMPKSVIRPEFKNELTDFVLPQFYKKEVQSLFCSDEEIPLTKENLSNGFSLRGESTNIEFGAVEEEVMQIDVEDSDSTPKFRKLSEPNIKYFKKAFSEIPHEQKIREAKKILYSKLDQIDGIESSDLKRYIDRLIDSLTPEQITGLQTNTAAYISKIKKHIETLLSVYQYKTFIQYADAKKIICKDKYRLTPELPIDDGITTIDKSLYTIEDSMNTFEKRVIVEVASLDNILWWHRNKEKRDFCINGFINHYPDFIIKTKSDQILLIETKGDYLDNEDSKRKAKLGSIWKDKAGDKYQYYMVFENLTKDVGGVYSLNGFINLLKTIP